MTARSQIPQRQPQHRSPVVKVDFTSRKAFYGAHDKVTHDRFNEAFLDLGVPLKC